MENVAVETAKRTVDEPSKMGQEQDKKNKPGRKPKRIGDGSVRYFGGEIKGGLPQVTQEFESEPEAQLHSLQTKQPYFVIQGYSVTPKIDGGTLSFEKSPIA